MREKILREYCFNVQEPIEDGVWCVVVCVRARLACVCVKVSARVCFEFFSLNKNVKTNEIKHDAIKIFTEYICIPSGTFCILCN